MADAKISALPSATVPLAGTEVLPVVQGGVTDKVTAADLLRQNGQTVTTSNPVLSLAQTWNAGGVTFTGMLFNATDTASASGSLLLDLKVGGATQFSVTKAGAITAGSTITGPFLNITSAGNTASLAFHLNGLALNTNAVIGWTSSAATAAVDTVLVRDAANTLALRNSTNAQTFNLYGTYTSSTSYERGFLTYDGAVDNSFILGTEKGSGGGAARPLIIKINGTQRWYWSTSGDYFAYADNTYDIGASGANRPRTGYFGTKIAIQNASLGSNALDVYTGTAGTIAAFQSNGLATSGQALSINIGNAVTGSAIAMYAACDASANWMYTLQNNNSGGGGAKYHALVLGTGDPYMHFEVNGGTGWSHGLDNSDSDSYKISQASGLGTNDRLTILTGGNVGIGTTAPASHKLVVIGGNADTLRIDNAGEQYTSADFYNGGTSKASIYYDNTGSQLVLRTAVAANLGFDTNLTRRWTINTSGHFLAASDNVYDIGASGVNRPRSVYAGTNFIVTGAGSYNWDSRSVMSSPSDGVIRLSNNAVTDFSRLQFGGTTSSFPAIARNAAEIDFTLADNSARCGINVGSIASYGGSSAYVGTAVPAGGTTGTGFRFSSATNFGVFFGSGAPTLSAAKGSLYLRSDGSGTGDRMYVNTDGSTSWTAVTTAA